MEQSLSPPPHSGSAHGSVEVTALAYGNIVPGQKMQEWRRLMRNLAANYFS